MDELLSPRSTFLTPSPPSQFSPVDGYHDQILEFASCEQWLLGEIDVSAKWSAGSSSLSPDSKVWELPPARLPQTPRSAATTTTTKRRGRKPGPRVEGHSVSHVEAERQRRDKLNRRFCDLRAAVPTVSRMDKASLLADAANYIGELRSRIAQLEEESRQPAVASASFRGGHGGAYLLHHQAADEVVEVRMVGRDEAAVRVTTTGGALQAPARLMGALRSLELQVQHACVSRVQSVTVQDVVVEVPAALQLDHADTTIHSALLHRLRGSA